MQRSHQAEVRAKLEQEQQKTLSEAQWVIDSEDVTRANVVAPTRFQIDQSYLSFTDVPVVGRKSFKSFNKEIETLAQTQESQQRLKKSEIVDARESLSDKELANRYKNLATGGASSGDEKKKGKDGKKEGKKRKSDVVADSTEGSEHGSAQRFKFLKPSVDE
ncbi:hypothetical protein HDU79_001382 [Rhizoclosmatium sp. JEL0117]|nr:hypothetical protein HDU79_001382 [Rhizoclosmatium sp. JEL0117]